MNDNYDVKKDVTDIKLKISGIESDVKAHEDIILWVKKSQTILAQETVEIIEIIADKADTNQINTMNAIDEFKKSQKNWWKNLHWVIKLIFILFAVSYIAGYYYTVVKMAH